jgi:uncharacterized protein YukJ
MDALADLELLLSDQARLFVFGEPFERGRGVHNVHQNQGDPRSSVWSSENGIWQDGALVVRRRSGAFAAYLTKYGTLDPTTRTSTAARRRESLSSGPADATRP